jgi:hypothetical protein
MILGFPLAPIALFSEIVELTESVIEVSRNFNVDPGGAAFQKLLKEMQFSEDVVELMLENNKSHLFQQSFQRSKMGTYRNVMLKISIALLSGTESEQMSSFMVWIYTESMVNCHK